MICDQPIQSLFIAGNRVVTVGSENVTEILKHYGAQNEVQYICFARNEVKFEFQETSVVGIEYVISTDDIPF